MVHQAEGKKNKDTWASKKGDFAQGKDFCLVLGLCSDTNFAEVLPNGEVSLFSLTFTGLPRRCTGQESCQCKRRKRSRFDSWVRKIPWRRVQHPTPVSLPGESHGQRSLGSYGPQHRKELDMTEATWHARTHEALTYQAFSPFQFASNAK